MKNCNPTQHMSGTMPRSTYTRLRVHSMHPHYQAVQAEIIVFEHYLFHSSFPSEGIFEGLHGWIDFQHQWSYFPLARWFDALMQVLNLECQECGKPCKSQTELDLHTKRTGHTNFADKVDSIWKQGLMNLSSLVSVEEPCALALSLLGSDAFSLKSCIPDSADATIPAYATVKKQDLLSTVNCSKKDACTSFSSILPCRQTKLCF